jgi:hypothetical protein
LLCLPGAAARHRPNFHRRWAFAGAIVTRV